ncbi:Transposable element P transposase [Frankliniella fusca]|uniref:Transposable element P transposase n=1 Tax=Frankliniella fusca TaxID=407009 RepID=A0AAE1L9T4_9NEOP|nr:Transposable element P transposase [Frankliniella fusca]
MDRDIHDDRSSGRIIGFANVSEVSKELNSLQSFLDNADEKSKVVPPIASKVLSFMVRGVARNVKEVVASYAVDNLTKEQLYCWSWEVICKLEVAGIAVVAFCQTLSGVIFDTVNKATPHRQLYFILDVPHLLKTIGNCFQRSTKKNFEVKNGRKIWKRCLQKNGQYILWSTIIRIFREDEKRPLRQCYKLNAKNVFLNSYSCMKVGPAAKVMSNTVASYLGQENRSGTGDNDWFDMLNGNDLTEGKRKNNSNLNPYERLDDERFDKLLEFLAYLKEWKDEAEATAMNSTLDNSSSSATAQSNPEDPASDPTVGAEEEDENASPASIEIATREFIGTIKFLLREGVKKIITRVTSQDPVEQYFSKQRCKGGRNPNPNCHRRLSLRAIDPLPLDPRLNCQQFLNNQGLIHIQGEMGSRMSFGTGNTEVANERLQMTCKKNFPNAKVCSLFPCLSINFLLYK